MGGGPWPLAVSRAMMVDLEPVLPNAAAVVLRLASEGDLAGICRIERLSFSDPWSERDFRSVINFGHAIFLVAASETSGDVAGYAIALTVADQAEILNLAVDPSTRREGVGGRLIDGAISAAEARGAKAMFLEVRESNRAARQLYASRGFEEISRRRGYYRAPVEDALVLRRAAQR